jgi:hypothetical protein
LQPTSFASVSSLGFCAPSELGSQRILS